MIQKLNLIRQQLSIVFFLITLLVTGLYSPAAFSQCQQLVWSDEFNTPTIDLTKWEFQTGNGTAYGLAAGWGNSESQYYTSSSQNASIVNGKLVITARYEPNYLGSGLNYTSARLRSRGKGDWKYGRFEASIKVPEPFGDSKHWPAFWMLPYNSNWPTTGEIDIMETGANGEPWKYHGTIHYNCSPCPAPKNRNTGTGGVNIPAGNGVPGDYDLSKQFHTYRVDWFPNLIEWYVDGIKVGQRVPADLTSTGALTSDWPFEATGAGANFHAILNMAIGGWFPGTQTPNSARYPLSMEVDWVRVYSSNTSATQINGESKILQGETGKVYSVAAATGTYNWTVPSGATITSGQGTNSIIVDYGSSSTSGNVSVTITPGGSCVPATAILPVTVVANTCQVILDDFEDPGQRNLGYNFSTGWMNRPGTGSPSDPYGSYANPGTGGVNTSARVCKYERNAGVAYDVLAYNDIILGNADHMKAGVMAFNMDVRTDAPAGTTVMIQLENRVNAQNGWPNGIHSRYTAVTGTPNTWNRLVFTLLDAPDATMPSTDVDQIVVLFNPNSYTGNTYYFDNFRRMGTTPTTAAIAGITSLCQNQSGVTYTTSGLTGSTFTWTVPSGAIIVSGQGSNSITVDFGTTGGNVTVTEKTSVNCTGTTKTLPVTVAGSCNLTADFSASTTTVCSGGTVTFTDQTTGKTGGETYSWNFGAGASLPAGTTGAGPHSVTYSTGGTKTVSLTVTRTSPTANSTETKTNYITVENPPTGCLFNDDYDNATVNFITPIPGAFTHTETGTAWSVSNAGYGEWEYFNYALNNGSNPMSLNFKCPANKPLVKIRAKASANCILRVTMGDVDNKEAQNNYLQPLNTLELTTAYQEFTIDFKGMMWDQYNGGGNLDTSAIDKLIFRVNPGYTSYPYVGSNGTYNTAFGGTIDIDWIGIGDNCNQFALPPTISSFTPSCVSSGTSVTITGTNLTDATNVSFNGVAASITGNTATQITATVPAGITNGKISVTTSGGTVTSTGNFTVAVMPSVSIALTTGNNPSCAGSSMTFTATPTNGGTTPSYQWKVNGTNAGTNSPTFTSTAITNGQAVTCVMTSNLTCVTSATATSNSITINRTANVTPTVSIALTTGSNLSCAGSSLTFTATPTNGGTTPSYQWKVNGTNAGTDSPTFTSTSITNGQAVTCVITSNAACVTSATATSNSVTINRTANVTPAVSISLTTGSNPSCAGSSLTFTATPTNGGTTPSYQWKVNGTNAGTNSPTFTSTAITNGQAVTCVITSNATCVTTATATSNSITINRTANVTPVVSIALTTGSNPSCAGSSLTFTATPTNGGTTPSYQWKVNGTNAGTDSPTFTSTAITNGQAVTCVLTSNAACATTATATSNSVTINRTANVTPAVSIALTTGNNPSCAGSSLTFTATPTNGGATPSYQWKVNGTNAGTNSATFTSTAITNGQAVTCVLTSNAACVTSATATSNAVTINRTANVTPAVSIALTTGSNPGCAGSSLTFTATPTNGGTTPSYQWKVNGTNAGTDSPTFTSTSITNGQAVTCVMTSNATCVTTATASSNSITVNRTANVTPAVSIALTMGSNPSCAGSSLTLTATPTNGGTTPAYQWKVNGTNVGTNSPSYTSSSISNGQVVTCKLTSSQTCVTSANATSNSVIMNITPTVIPSVTVSITSGSNPTCSGSVVSFTASAVNGGTTPSYQWKVNGINAGTNSAVFTSSTLANSDIISCELTSNETCANPVKATSSGITMTVNSTQTPGVSIALTSGSNPSCNGSSLTFTASPVNGGSSPSYQWKVNGTNAGTNSATFTSSALSNTDVVSCLMTSSSSCASPATATSNSIKITRSATVAPSVSVALTSGSNPSCSGNTMTFTASPANGGSAPAYQWKVDGNNVGTNSASYTSSALSSGNVISCVMTSNSACASPLTATSNNITVTVNSTVSTAIGISITGGTNPACAGNAVTFTASSTNGGTSPVYQWKVNGTNAGSNSSSYSTNGLVNGDVVTCQLTSNATCASPASITSSGITMSVNSTVTPTISINLTSGSNPSCSGAPLTFTATASNGGSTPAYQWMIDGSNAGTNSNTFSSSTLTDGNVLTCQLTSNAACASSPTVTSSGITMSISSNVTPSVSVQITGGSNPICEGGTITYTAVPTGGGNSPSYQWKVNNNDAGSNSDTYSYVPANGDEVRVVLTTSLSCANSSTANSASISMQTDTPPSTANAGPDQLITANMTALSANTPATGMGSWSVMNGNGTFFSNSDPGTTVSALASGDNVLRWTVHNGTCTDSYDDVKITVTPQGIFGTSNTSSNNYSLYPNPFIDQTTLQVHSTGTSLVTITVKDMKGRTMQNLESYTNTPVEIGQGLEAGLYIVEVVSNNSVSIIKMKKAE